MQLALSYFFILWTYELHIVCARVAKVVHYLSFLSYLS